MIGIEKIKANIAAWRDWRQGRAAQAKAPERVAAEIEKLVRQRSDAIRQHRPVRAIDARLKVLVTLQLKLELSR